MLGRASTFVAAAARHGRGGAAARRWMRATPAAFERILASDQIEDVAKEILEEAG